MKTHDEVMGLLPRYDTLGPAERAAVDEHLAGCPVCAARLAIFRHIEAERAASERAVLRGRGEEQSRPPLARPLLALGVLALAVVAWLAARGELTSLPRLATLFRPAPAPIVTPAPTPPPLPTITPEPTVETGASPDSIAWLRQHGAPFRGAEPGDLGDLAPLEEMIGQAQVVVISDPTFGGTHETLAMRQRLLELLVERMGFSVVLAETPWDTGVRINTFIQGGTGLADDASLGIDGLPLNQEWMYTLHWLREHNAGPGNAARVTFAGFLPPRYMADPIVSELYGYLTRVAPEADLSAVVARGDRQLVDWLASRREQLITRSSVAEFDQALADAQALIEFAALESPGGQQSAQVLSEGFTASNLTSLLARYANQRVLIWRTTTDLMLASSGGSSLLRQRYGSRAVFITFAFYQGSVYANPSAWPPNDAPHVRAIHVVPPAPTGSYETWLHAAGIPRLLLDMRPSLDDASRLPTLSYTRNLAPGVDDCYPEDNYIKGSIADNGDLLVFFDQVTPPTFLARVETAQPPACRSGPENLDFAHGTQGWSVTDAARQFEVTTGKGEGRITARAAEPGRLSSGVLSQSFRADDYRGQRVRLTVTAQTEAAVAASLWIEADLPAFQSQAHVTQPLPGAFSQPYELDLYVPDDAVRITFGVQLHGQGQVTVRGVKFEVVKLPTG